MNYYQVLVATKNKTNRFLTYTFTSHLRLYQVVKVPVRSHLCSGLIVKKQAPSDIEATLKSKCRPIDEISPYRLPDKLVKAVFTFGKNSGLSLSAIAKLLLSNAVIKPVSVKSTTMQSEQQIVDLPLTKFQDRIYRQITTYKDHRPQLLLGVNGSGKTRIYAQLIKDQIKAKRSTLILVPEIGLSSQVVELLKTYLKTPLNHFHSRLTPKQKKVLWQKCLVSNEALIVIGPRSAGFLPFQNLGLIILDEFHDDSFKQDHQPSYHCLQVASYLAKTYRAQLVCGSATPRVEDYYHFTKANYPIYRLRQKALAGFIKPKIKVVDKNEEKHIFSRQALKQIIASLKSEHQVLIFYNRRGHWRLVQCGQCSWYAQCPSCWQNLVFHQDKFKLICHGCHFKQQPMSVCPQCLQSIRYTTAGIKAVEMELKTHLDNANLKVPLWRFDGDNLKQETLSTKITTLKEQRAAVILGTQVVSQGLDLPNLQTVVILNADQVLAHVNYRTQEKYYQNIHQLSGRVGRGHLQKTYIILQTYQPRNLVVKYAVNQNWLKFYKFEIKQRQKYQLPPFSHLANIVVRRYSQAATKKAALRMYQDFKDRFENIKFYQPAPSLQEKRAKYWEWLICVSSPRRAPLLKLARELSNKVDFINLDPSQLFDNRY